MSNNLILAELDKEYAASDTTTAEKINSDRSRPLRRPRRHLLVLWLTALSLHALLWPGLFILTSVAYMLICGDVDASLLVPEILLLATVCVSCSRWLWLYHTPSESFLDLKAEQGFLGYRVRLQRPLVHDDCASESASVEWVVASRRARSEVDLLGPDAGARRNVACGLRHLHHRHCGETASLRDECGCGIR